MKNYIRQVIELFSQNDYPVSVQKQFRHWLADEEHKEEKNGSAHFSLGRSRTAASSSGNAAVYTPYATKYRYASCLFAKEIYITYLAGSVGVVAGCIVGFYLFIIGKRRFFSDLIECHIPTAEIHELTLPDGTSVMLNSKSTLFYPESFNGKTRSVYLIGEGYFKVMPDKEHPFIVKGSDFQVTALGTEFNVNTYSENDEVYTTLVSGSVKVEYDNLISSVILKPNQQLSYNKLTKKKSFATITS